MTQWAAEQLAAILGSLAHAEDPDDVVRQVVELAAESLEADVVGYLEGDRLRHVTGLARSAARWPEAAVLAVARPGPLHLPGLGAGVAHVAALDSGRRLVAVRLGVGGFDDDDRTFLRATARVLDLSLRAARRLSQEQDRRSDTERTVAGYREAVHRLEQQRQLLERLARLQRGLTGGAPVLQVVERAAAAARELLDADTATVAWADPDAATDDAGVTAVAGEPAPAGAAREVVIAPLDDERGHRVGSITVELHRDPRPFSVAERRTLASFAAHAALALSEARTAEALQQSLRSARHDALHDVLTGLPNRALLRDRLHQAVSRARRNGSTTALLFCDLDAFKHVNDSLGHDSGDALLCLVARRLGTSLRPGDTIARLGGDEFAVLLEDLASDDEATEVGERLLASLAEPVSVLDRRIDVDMSIGVALWDGRSPAPTLLSNADLAMYEAKRSGGGRLVVFEPDMHERTVARLDIEHALRPAIGAGELVVHYQPLVDPGSGRVAALEALVRWQHPTRGLLRPDEFVPVAEGSATLIQALGDEVLRQALSAAAGWPRDIGVAVNVSPRQVTDDLCARVIAACDEAGVDPHRLTVEVTESVVMAERDTVHLLRELRDHGVAVAIDDFGTGHSSLGRLRRLPVDQLKVDAAFVRDLGSDAGVAVMGAILALGRAAGLRCVAEGVEDRVQLEALRALGCDLVQGYLVSAPLPAGEVAALLRGSWPPAETGEPAPSVGAAPSWPHDVLVLRRIGGDAFAHIGGQGRGQAWAGVVTVPDGPPEDLPAQPGEIRRVGGAQPVRVVGPYWAADAAVVRVTDDLLVVLSDPQVRVSERADAELQALALRHAWAVGPEDPAKRLSDELEVLAAVRDLTTTRPESLRAALERLATVALESLSCGVAVAALESGHGAAAARAGALPAPEAQLVAQVRSLGDLDDGGICVQDAATRRPPGALADVAVSWSALALPGAVRGTLLVAHTADRPRGFTSLCQRLARELVAAAEGTLELGALRETAAPLAVLPDVVTAGRADVPGPRAARHVAPA